MAKLSAGNQAIADDMFARPIFYRNEMLLAERWHKETHCGKYEPKARREPAVPGAKRRPKIQYDMDGIVARIERGDTTAAIAEDLDVADSSLRKQIRRCGLSVRAIREGVMA